MSVSFLNSPPPPRQATVAQGAHPTLNERAPLLPKSASNRSRHPAPSLQAKRSWFTPNEYWVIPFWLIASFTRGMTLAPRVEVYSQLACQAYHHEARVHPHPHSSALYVTSPSSPYTIPRSCDEPFFDFAVFKGASNDSITLFAEPMHVDTADPVITRSPNKACFTDPVVQQHAARLQMAVTLTMGVLSASTTGWWSTVSDRLGRTRVMAISLFGYLFTDVMFLVVARYARFLVPFGGHRLLILGPFVEGILGGWTTVTAAASAYVSDVTVHGSRAKSFGRMQGLMFVGVAAGPAFGSLLLRFNPDILIIFTFSVAISLLTVIYAAFIVPESLTEDIRQERDRKRIVAREEHLAYLAHAGAGPIQRLKATIAEFFEPATLFLPRGNDWRLTFLGFAVFTSMLTAGAYPLKLLYAERTFEWTAVQLGNYLTIIGSVRSFWLLVALPVVIKLFKPAHPSLDPASQPDPSAPAIASSSRPSDAAPLPSHSTITADLKFDINLARLSYGVDALSYVLVVLVGTISANAFVLATLLSALGGGAPPVVQSIALCLLPNPREDSGKMLGALSMVQAVAGTIVSPLVFGILYSETVKVFPEAIFVCGGVLVGLSAFSLLFVTAGFKQKKKKIVRRGRSTRRKPLVSSSRATSLSGAGYTTDEESHV